MILDAENLFSDKQAVLATIDATNTVNLGVGAFGASSNASLFVGAAPYAGAGTLVVELLTADSVDATGNLVTPVTIATYPITNAALKAGGKLVDTRLPMGLKKYAGVKYTVTGTITALPAGSYITTGIVFDA